jgi:dTDP-glucose 4,6-dehydratase
MIRVLLTGGAGFVGHHMTKNILLKTDWDIVIIDRLSYASVGLKRLREIGAFDNKRVTIYTADFADKLSEGVIKEIGQVDYILHFGAETAVEQSIKNPEQFVRANVFGTLWMLEFARSQKHLRHFVYLSTDEVFGPAKEQDVFFKAWDRYNSTNPYSATKAAGEELTLAFANTYGIPTLVIHSMNLFGERQHNEKFIPTVVRRVLHDEVLPIYSDPSKTKAGSRFYLYCETFADIILFLLEKANKGEKKDKYNWGREKINIVGEREVDNLELAQMIAQYIGKKVLYEMVDFHSSRPGHDLRYSLDGSDLIDLGWTPELLFEQSLQKTVKWMLENKSWLYD